MSFVSIPGYAKAPLSAAQYARNGKCPDAVFQGALADAVNAAAAIRTKEVARFGAATYSIPILAARRWRFAFCTSPFARLIWMRVTLTMPDKGADNSGCRLIVRDAAGTLIGTAIAYQGGFIVSPPTTPSYWSHFDVPLDDGAGNAIIVPAGTVLFGEFDGYNNGRPVAVSVYESSMLPDTANGYAPSNYTSLAPVLAGHRTAVAAAARAMWQRGGAHLANWSCGLDSAPAHSNTTVATNLIDLTSTTVSAATPGITLDLRYCARAKDAGQVPVTMYACGAPTSGAVGGSVVLKDSAGTTLATVGTFTALAPTAGAWLSTFWKSASFSLPATLAKYDFQIVGSASPGLDVYAVSLFPTPLT